MYQYMLTESEEPIAFETQTIKYKKHGISISLSQVSQEQSGQVKSTLTSSSSHHRSPELR